MLMVRDSTFHVCELHCFKGHIIWNHATPALLWCPQAQCMLGHIAVFFSFKTE